MCDAAGEAEAGEWERLTREHIQCHGLMGFNKLRLVGDWIPGIECMRLPSLPSDALLQLLIYAVDWRGISDCLQARGVQIIVSTVPPTSTIEQRAEALAEGIRKAGGAGKSVNLIG